MTRRLIQCAPNFSEGRDPAVIAALAEAVRTTPDVALVDVSSDPDHHRSVITYLGESEGVAAASLAAARVAVARIDLTRHSGAHPRMGALDVLPFVPFGETPMAECVRTARAAGAVLAAELALPVYYYEEAAVRPERRNLARVRGAGFEALRGVPLAGEQTPDAGPDRVHPTAGATAVGARGPLLAYNVNLATDDLEIARAIAHVVRERDGGLPGVKALGLRLASRGLVQVSMNLTRPAEASLARAFQAVRDEAALRGVEVLESELVGAIRLEELADVARDCLRLNVKAAQVLDLWAAGLGTPGESEGKRERGKGGKGERGRASA